MKRRIRSIFILMTACILAINLFQGYWLYTTYTMHQQQFSRTVDEALWRTLQKQQEFDAQRLFRTEAKGGGPVRVFYKRFGPIRRDSLGGIPWEQPDRALLEMEEEIRTIDSSRNVVQFRRMPARDSLTHFLADTVARQISNRLVISWMGNEAFNLPRLDSLYKTELALQAVNAEFKLDTIHYTALARNPPSFEKKSYAEYPIQIRPVPINPVHNLFLLASFKPPVPYILQRMGWLLMSSFLLLILTTGCFLYMLSTILRQKKLSELRNDFINNMTHELKTPLATVSAAVEALQSFGALNDAQKAQNYLSISKNELQRLSELVDKVLHMAVEEKQEFVLHPEPIYPEEFIREIVTHQQLKVAKAVEFVVDVPAESPPVQVDRLHVENTLNNLIDNAIKYSHERVTIRISSLWEGNTWRLAVRDSGIGIPKSYHQAIFDRFFRVPTGNLHQVKGFGLGLSYVKQVVERHGGWIEVRSEPAQGSEFVLWFPMDEGIVK